MPPREKSSEHPDAAPLAKALGFTMVDGVPSLLLAMDDEALQDLRDRIAKNWLANDGVWFQTIETSEGMNEAKRCNDSCWAQFSPFEAICIRQMLGLPENPGLDGLKRALGFRVYECINKQSIVEETPDSFVFHMNECRVQDARKRKGLEDYPCKSAGLGGIHVFRQGHRPENTNRMSRLSAGCPPGRMVLRLEIFPDTAVPTAAMRPECLNTSGGSILWSSTTVLYEEDGAVATVTINRPKALNALNQETLVEMLRCFQELAAKRGDPGGDHHRRRRKGLCRRGRYRLHAET